MKMKADVKLERDYNEKITKREKENWNENK